MRDLRKIPFVALVALGLLLGALRIGGSSADLYPVEGDAAKYDQIARGFAKLYGHPLAGFRLWITRSADLEDLKGYGFDSWILQHAPAYTSMLGWAYRLPGNDVLAGRWYNVLLLSFGAGLLFLLGTELFGFWQGIAAGLLFLLWPPNWFYGPAILTEIPMAFAAVLAAYLMLRTRASARWRAFVLGGAGIGFLVLTKTPLRFVAIPWIAIELLIDRDAGDLRFRLRRAAGRLAGWGALQLVWLVFLWGFHLSPNPLASTGDDWMWVYRGNYVPDRGWETLGVGDAITPELIAGARAAESHPEGERRPVLYRTAFEETARRYPAGLAALVVAKAGIFWQFPAVKTFVDLGPLALPPPVRLQPALAVAALFAVAGCVGARRQAWRLVPVVFPVFLTALHAASHYVSRYNLPAVPFAILYGTGGIGAAVIAARAAIAGRGRGIAEGLRSGRSAATGGAAIAGVALGALLLPSAASPRAIAGVWIAAASLAPLAGRLLGGGRRGLVRAGCALLPLAILASGAIVNDPDPDERSVRLARPGDGVRLTLRLPSGINAAAFASADLLIDLLPSRRGAMRIAVRCNGEEIARFDPRPPLSAEDLRLDARIDPERYARIEKSTTRHLEGFIRRLPGMRAAGHDEYRRWQRVPIDPERVLATGDGGGATVLEIVLLESGGGTCDVFLDRDAPAGTGDEERILSMPAFFENPFDLSNYRFDTLCSDRRLADARLIRPARLFSQRVSAERVTREGTRPLTGEPRMRIRAQLRGGYGLVDQGGGRYAPAWVPDPSLAQRMLEPAEITRLQADRDWYDGGRITF